MAARKRPAPAKQTGRRSLVESLESRRLLSASIVKDINTAFVGAASNPENLTSVNGTLFFYTAGTEGGAGNAVYRSDGTAAGTTKLATVGVFSGSMAAAGDLAYFVSGTTLWASDGTAGGTRAVKNIGFAPQGMTDLNGVLYFCERNDGNNPLRLWRSDGTADGTFVVKTITEGNVSPKNHQLTRVGNSLYFLAYSGLSRYDIYKSDGTAGGTVVAKTMLSTSQTPTNSHPFAGHLYFTGEDTATTGGVRLWRTDGTTTAVVTDAAGNAFFGAKRFSTVGDTLYFVPTLVSPQLWRTDGTAAGTAVVGPLLDPGTVTSAAALDDGTLVWSDWTSVGHELLRTTGSGVQLLKDINAKSGVDSNNKPWSSTPDSLTSFDGKIYFSADDGTGGRELWRTDGTAAGTVPDAELFPGSVGSTPRNLIDVNGTLFFSATTPTQGTELFKVVGRLAAPLGLLATAVGDARVDLAWGNPGAHATGFRVERSTDGVNFTQIAALADPAAGGYADTAGIAPQTKYYYRVRATTAAGDTPFSGRAAATTEPAVPVAPGTPQAAAVAGSTTSIALNWTDRSGTEAGFRVYRSADPSTGRTYQLVATTAAGAQAYVDTGLVPDTRYYYVVAAFNARGESAAAAVSAATRKEQAPLNALPAPVPGVVQAEDFDRGGATIAYADTSLGNAGGQYRPGDDVDVFATTDAGGGFRVEAVATEWLEYTVDAGAAGGTFHVELRVAAAAAGGRVHLEVDGLDVSGPIVVPNTGATTAFLTVRAGDVTLAAGVHVLRLAVDANPSGTARAQVNWVRFTAAGSGTVPVAPTGLAAAALSRTQVDLSWADQATNESGFSVERRTLSDGAWTVVGHADAGATGFGDRSIAPLTTYGYRVRAVNTAGVSTFTAEATVTTPDAPAVLVRDVNSTSPDSDPRNLVTVNGLTYFTADDRSNNWEQLWVTDGTAAGTVRLTQNLRPISLTRVGDLVYFTNDYFYAEAELWRSDGTVAGTFKVKDIYPGPNSSQPANLTDVNGTLFFTAYDQTGTGRELWKSDGTDAGTVVVRDINLPGSSNPSNMVNVNGRLVFTAEDVEAGTSLWASDGTGEGTRLIADPVPGTHTVNVDLMSSGGGLAYFRQNGLWRTDGTAAGTFKLTETSPPSVRATALGGFFVAGQNQLWHTTGTVAGTVPVGPAHGVLSGTFADVGGALFYFAVSPGEGGPRLWRSDGTTAGTGPVSAAGAAPFVGTPSSLVAAGAGLVYFAADDGPGGVELWTSDGTPAGTRRVADIVPGTAGSDPRYLSGDGAGGVRFSAWQPGTGREIWRSDGTEAGTVLIKDLRTTPTETSNPRVLTVVGDVAYFWAGTADLWRTDGTAAGTSLVKAMLPSRDFPSPIVNVNGTIYFYAHDPVAGRELFKSDGTAAGTVRVTDLLGGPTDSYFLSMTAVGGALYFGGPGQGAEYGLWRTDGTAGGTVLVQNLPGANGVQNIGAVGGAVYFTTGIESAGTYQLWKTDGAVGGGTVLATISAGSFAGSPVRFTPAGGLLYFAAGDAGSASRRLWRTDGTPAGTFVLAGSGSAAVDQMTAVGGTVFFSSGASELWATDGTPAGTKFVRGFAAYSIGNDLLRYLTPMNGLLYFMGREAATGQELWVSDGTAAGTRVVADLVPGSGASAPVNLTDVGGSLFFRAHNGAAGLWRTDGTTGGTRPVHNFTGVFPNMDNLVALGPDLLFTADDGVHGREVWKAYGPPPEPVGQVVLGGDGARLTWTTAAGAAPTGASFAALAADLPAGTITGFGIERKDGSAGAWAQIGVAGPGATSYVDRTTSPGVGYAYRIRAVGSGGESYSEEFAAAAAPPRFEQATVNGGAAQRSMVGGLTVTFDLPVVPDAGAFSLAGRNGAGAGVTVAAANPSGDGRTWVLTFAGPGLVGGSLPDGVYDLTVVGSRVRGGSASGPTMAADHVVTFHRLFGDANNSKSVNNADYGLFRTAFGKPAADPAYSALFDFDNSGAVNNADYAQFRTRFGTAFTY